MELKPEKKLYKILFNPNVVYKLSCRIINQYLFDVYWNDGRFYGVTQCPATVFKGMIEITAADNTGDYDWYFGNAGYGYEGVKDSNDSKKEWKCELHDFPNTGMKKSWCVNYVDRPDGSRQWCGEEGLFSVQTGKYETIKTERAKV
jgi:hypothetical protein